MKFYLGLVTGAVLGFAGAVIYAGRTGRDLRETYDAIRSDIDRRDFDALGSRFDARFAEMQALIEQRIGDVKAKAGAAADKAREGAGDAAETAQEAGQDALEGAAEAIDEAKAAAQDVADAAPDEGEGSATS